jgi:ribosomal protein L1
MAHKSKLTIDSVAYELLSCSYHFHQHVNPHTNETTSEVFGGTIELSVETRNGDAHVVELMLLPHKDNIEGKIEFFNQKGEELRTIQFKHASVVSFGESFSLSGGGSGAQSFTVCAREIDINGKTLKLLRE